MSEEAQELYYLVVAAAWVVSSLSFAWTRIRTFRRMRRFRRLARNLYDLGLIAFFLISPVNSAARVVWFFGGRENEELGLVWAVGTSVGVLAIAWTSLWAFVLWQTGAEEEEEALLISVLRKIREGESHGGSAKPA
jgi:hypothetical protein